MSNKVEGGVNYTQGMTDVWSDGDKVVIRNRSGFKWVESNVDQIFGVGEWKKIQNVAYTEVHHPPKRNKNEHVNAYECISGYIPQRIINDLKEELPEEDKKKAALEALRDS